MLLIEIDANGKISLPDNLRYQLGLNDGDELLVKRLGENAIVLEKMVAGNRFEHWLLT